MTGATMEDVLKGLTGEQRDDARSAADAALRVLATQSAPERRQRVGEIETWLESSVDSWREAIAIELARELPTEELLNAAIAAGVGRISISTRTPADLRYLLR